MICTGKTAGKLIIVNSSVISITLIQGNAEHDIA